MERSGHCGADPSSDNYNAIDPCPFVDDDGSMWLSFGSYWSGIKSSLDPATGKRITPGSTIYSLAGSNIEASYLYKRGGYYYLFVNNGVCCSGVNSTYNIRVGRSTSVTGPYLNRSGQNLVSNDGTLSRNHRTLDRPGANRHPGRERNE